MGGLATTSGPTRAGQPVSDTYYPRYYAVNDRPVKLVLLDDGRLDDRSYFAKVSESGIGKDVDQFTEQQFADLVVALRRPIVARLLTRPLPWTSTGDGEHPYRAEEDGHTYVLRVDDFPAEPLYTLLADGDELADLEDWPAAWRRPDLHTHAPHELDTAARRLRTLAERLCTTTGRDEDAMRAALGIPTDPPPMAAAHCTLRAGDIPTVDLQFDDPVLRRADLDDQLGAATALPRTGPGAHHVLAYPVRVPDAPSTVHVFARFTEPPEPSTVVHGVLLRIDPA